LQRSMA